MSAPDFADFAGRSRSAEDVVEPWRFVALASAHNLDLPRKPGDPLPLPFHLALFREAIARTATGVDGHPRRGISFLVSNCRVACSQARA